MSTQFNDTKRTLTTGDVVISVAEIFDRLQTKVDPNTLEQLLRDILAGRRSQVRPGELITAELINQILAELESLETRVTALESTKPVTKVVEITGFDGITPFRVGQPVTMKGHGFSVPAALNKVTIGGVPVTGFGFDSGATQLTFTIPNVTGLTEAGTEVPVTVTIQTNDQDTSQLTIRPALLIPKGRIEVVYTNPPVMPTGELNITGARTYIFGFEITTFVDRDATYTLSPGITGTGTWTATMLQDAAGGQANVISTPAGVTGVTRAVRVSVTVPAGQANASAGVLTLAVNENTANTEVLPGNGQISILIGSPPPTPETRVRISLAGADPPASISGNGARFPRNGGQGTLRFVLHFTVGGAFTVTPSMRNATGWTAADIDLPSFTVQSPAIGTSTNQPIMVVFGAGASASNTDFLLRVQGPGGINVQYALGVTVV
jgi:hypothetical protein